MSVWKEHSIIRKENKDITVKELKEQLKNVDDSLELIIEMVVIEKGIPTERNELVDHVEINDKEFYLIGKDEDQTDGNNDWRIRQCMS